MRFAVLLHEPPAGASGRHHDLFLELDEALLSFKVEPAIPFDEESFVAWRQADHRKRYLDYEGPISGDRGRVTRVDSGPMRGAARPDRSFEVELDGALMRGAYRFELLEDERWRVTRLAR